MAGISKAERLARELARQSVVIASQRALKEAKDSFRDADEIRSNAKTLLRPEDFLSGKADPATLVRYLTRNPDGSYRPLTFEDLNKFERLRKQLGTKLKKGVSAQDIIDLSRSIPLGQRKTDLDKSRQIHAAVPVATKGGEIRFATSTGPDSKQERQYVSIKMLNFESVVSSPQPADKLVKQATNGPLAVGCTCGQFRFVFAYMATVGGYGLPQHRETAFPKIKNATLTGIACKHIVKVATLMLQSATLKRYVSQLIEKERDRTQSALQRVKIAEMKEIQEKLAAEKNRTPKTTKQLKAVADARKAATAKQREAIAKANKKAADIAARKAKAKRGSVATIEAQLIELRKNLKQLKLSDAAIEAAVAAERAEIMRAR